MLPNNGYGSDCALTVKDTEAVAMTVTVVVTGVSIKVSM